MRTLIYKRTHPGDPDTGGCFGIHDCMGQIRRWNFDSVIGVGGIGAEPASHGLDGKVNWIGIGARKHLRPGGRGPLVTFEHFLLFEEKGCDFATLAPGLARRLYRRNVRALMHDLSVQEKREIRGILALAADAPPSKEIHLQNISENRVYEHGLGCECRTCSSRGGKHSRDRDC